MAKIKYTVDNKINKYQQIIVQSKKELPYAKNQLKYDIIHGSKTKVNQTTTKINQLQANLKISSMEIKKQKVLYQHVKTKLDEIHTDEYYFSL